MITYRVSSGDMNVTVETPHEAIAQQIAAIAIDRMVHKKKAPKAWPFDRSFRRSVFR